MADATGQDADAIRNEMAAVRSTLDDNVHELVENARNLTDWRYYVKAAPWGTVGAAAAIGYFIVPRRIQIIQPDADEIAKLAKRHQIVVEHKAKAEAKQGGPAQLVLTMLANAMLRAVTAYASQQAGKVFGQQAAEKPREQFNAEVRRP
ncbi:MAG: hypothetical protein M3552_08290 [Planctomycetota bacterium]|nr:hypothetical protein [Planctomycetaceae bacterium]MDQ3330638.1 hypothetical protein [Planctomycetota bacterium]